MLKERLSKLERITTSRGAEAQLVSRAMLLLLLELPGIDVIVAAKGATIKISFFFVRSLSCREPLCSSNRL